VKWLSASRFIETGLENKYIEVLNTIVVSNRTHFCVIIDWNVSQKRTVRNIKVMLITNVSDKDKIPSVMMPYDFYHFKLVRHFTGQLLLTLRGFVQVGYLKYRCYTLPLPFIIVLCLNILPSAQLAHKPLLVAVFLFDLKRVET
jgi:hypothetical protein